MLVKVVAVQARMGRTLCLAEKIHIFKRRPDFVCLPEYWMFDSADSDFHRVALRWHQDIDYLCRLSDELGTCLVAGSSIEASGDHIYTCSVMVNRGRLLGHYRKRSPQPGELKRGLSAGSERLIVDVDGVRVGQMICGDVFHPDMYDEMGDREVDLIMIPTASPYRPDDTSSMKKDRDRRYFLDGARRSGAYVVKACGVGKLFGKPLQGRSLIASPWGTLSQVDRANETSPRIISETIDIAELQDFRLKRRRLASTRGRSGGD
jgi:predicted amidohydrolase